MKKSILIAIIASGLAFAAAGSASAHGSSSSGTRIYVDLNPSSLLGYTGHYKPYNYNHDRRYYGRSQKYWKHKKRHFHAKQQARRNAYKHGYRDGRWDNRRDNRHDFRDRRNDRHDRDHRHDRRNDRDHRR